MFCKNCGNRLNEGAESCEACSFKKGHGNGYCAYCGEKIGENQTKCSNCGNAVGVEARGRTGRSQYVFYMPQVKKTNILALGMAIISLFLILSLVFLPIYKCNYEPQDIDEIENLEEFGEALEKGYIEKNFSLFDDIVLLVKALFEEAEGEEEMLGKLLVLEMGLFAFFEVIFSVVMVIILIKQILEAVNNIQNIDDATLLSYNGIKKSGREQEKPNFMKKQTVMTIVLYALFDVVFTKLFGVLNGLMESLTDSEGFYRYMNDISGVSIYSIFVFLMIIAVIVLQSMMKKEKKSMELSIAKEQTL